MICLSICQKILENFICLTDFFYLYNIYLTQIQCLSSLIKCNCLIKPHFANVTVGWSNNSHSYFMVIIPLVNLKNVLKLGGFIVCRIKINFT